MAASQDLTYSQSHGSAEVVDLSYSQSHGSAEVVDYPCSICQTRDKREVESIDYCVDCNYNMCTACSQWHKNFPAMAAHQVVAVSMAPGSRGQKAQLPSQRCQEHHGRIIDKYCQDDDKIVCETCVNFFHRNCVNLEYIPTFAKGTIKDAHTQEIIKATAELATPLKRLKSLKDENIKRLDKAEAKCHQEVGDLRTRLHKYVDNLADTEDAKITSKFQMRKEEVQKDITVIDDQIDATETISKDLNDCQGDNEAELFVYIKQGEKIENDVKQNLRLLNQSEVATPTYKINSNIENTFGDIKPLGMFEGTVTAKNSKTVRVKDGKDKSMSSRISGFCFLPDASIVLADAANQCLKQLDQSYKLTGTFDLNGSPCDVCYTDNNEVAVTMPYKNKIHFVTVGQTMQNTRSIDVGDFCRGIDYRNGELIVCCGSAFKPADVGIRVYNLSGTLLRTLQQVQDGKKLFEMPCYITISPCGNRLHVTDKTRMVTTDRAGKLLTTYTDLELTRAEGICCLENGDLLMCDKEAYLVHHVSSDGRKLEKILTHEIREPVAIIYNAVHSKLLVSKGGSDYIHMYDLD